MTAKNKLPFSLPTVADAPLNPNAPLNGQDRTQSLDIMEWVDHVRRRRRLVFASIGAGLLFSILVTLIFTPRYTATALLLASDQAVSDARPQDDNAIDIHLALLTSQPLLERVLAELQKDDDLQGRFSHTSEILRHLKIMQELRSHLISVNFTARSPEVAAKVANAVARRYLEDGQSGDSSDAQKVAQQTADAIANLQEQLADAQKIPPKSDAATDASPEDRAAAQNRVNELRQKIAELVLQRDLAQRAEEGRRQKLAVDPGIRIFALAKPPETPTSIRPVFVIIPATIAGALFGIFLALALGRLDPRVQSMEALQRMVSAPCFGPIPAKATHFITPGSPGDMCGDYDRAMESLVASTFLISNPGKRSMVVMIAEAGRTARPDFVFDFALAASRLKPVLFVDLVGSPHQIGGERQAEAPNFAHRQPASLKCISISSDHTSLLALAASGELADSIEELRLQNDWIIIAAPSLQTSPATQVVAGMVDKTILTVTAGKSRYDDVEAALRHLRSIDQYSYGHSPSSKIFLVLTDLTSEPPIAAPLLPKHFRDRLLDSPLRRRKDGGAGSARKETGNLGAAVTNENAFLPDTFK